jgi:hypothetical protein
MPKKETAVAHALLTYTLPPPIYGFELTVDPNKGERTVKVVSAMTLEDDVLKVISLEGQVFLIPIYQVKFYRIA